MRIRTGSRRFGTGDPLQNLLLVEGGVEEATVEGPTSAEWVIGEWVTLDRELHPFEALELATVIEAVKLHVLHGWPRWWAWTFASLVAQIAIGILEATAGEHVITPQRRAVAVRPTPGSSRARRRRRTCRGSPAPGLAHHAVAVAVPHERIRGMVARHRCDQISGIPLTATGQWLRGAAFGTPESCSPMWRFAPRAALNRLSGELSLPRLVQHPDESDRAVVGLLDREVDVSPGRLGTFVEVSVKVDRAHRYLAQRVVAQGQRWVGGAQRERALRRKPRFAQRGAVQVVVPEHEDPLARAVSDVEHQAPVAPGIRMGDVAQADDGVVGSYAAPPFANQMAVHLVDVAERAVEGLQRAGVADVQVAPDPRRLRDGGDDRYRPLVAAGQLEVDLPEVAQVLDVGHPKLAESAPNSALSS